MMYKMLAIAAVAATQLSAVSACGWANERCCNIPEGRPNQGTCYDPRNVCWEAQCMDCGTNGKKGCDTKPYCNDGFTLNKEGWCSGWVQDFSCDGGCGHGEACNPYGNCEPCGTNGKIACDGGKCEIGSTVNDEGYCSSNPHCGWLNEQCCEHDACFEGACNNGECEEVPTCDVWIEGKGIIGKKLRDVGNVTKNQCVALTNKDSRVVASSFEVTNARRGKGRCWMMKTHTGLMDANKHAYVKCD